GQGKELAVEATVDFALARALSVAMLCNEAELGDDGAEGKGSSTEAALLVAGRDAGLDYRAERRRHPLLRIRRRNDGDNWMATVHAGPAGDVVMVKGAPEQVLARADRWLDDGVERPLTADTRAELRRINDRIAARGLRVLGLAFKTAAPAAAPEFDALVWVGLAALTDPVRPGVGAAIRACRGAGIRTILLTGDHARTAAAIYRELDLGNGAPHVFDASHVDEVSPDTLRTLVHEVDVFARVSPADKYRIVRALQAGGEVVAMTGDGINDAAALRAADIGVAMGARGTDMARAPRDPSAPMLSKTTLLGISRDAGVLAATTLGVHALALARYGAGPRATTLAFSTLTSAQLLHAFTYRSRAPRDAAGAGRSVLPGIV